MKFWAAATIAGLAIWSAASAGAYGEYPIYGTHFYGTGEETSIKNGKGMWSVETLYTQRYTNPAAEKIKIQNIVNKGFRVILRIDFDYGQTVRANNDWNNRYAYAMKCRDIAQNMGSLVYAYAIGNEMTSAHEGAIPKEWYTKVFNGHDSNCAYVQIKAVAPNAIVCMGGLSGWPGFLSEANSNITFFKYFIDNAYSVDGFALHAYSGTSFYNNPSSPIEDPRYSDLTGLRSFGEYMKLLYAKWGPYKPVYITETNTYWFNTGFAATSYRNDWIKEAFQAIDEWNQGNDYKVDAFCWFTYSTLGITDPNSDIYGNALMRTDNARLNRARQDYAWVTANTNMKPMYPGMSIRLQAENYSNSDMWGSTNGIEGTDYHDLTAGNTGGAYRAENVDIAFLPDYSGFNVGWIDAGEWLRYNAIFGNNNYTLKIRYARGVTGNAQLHFTIDGTTYGGTINLPGTGGWNTYATLTGPTFYVPGGAHEIKLVSDTGAFNVDWFEFSR